MSPAAPTVLFRCDASPTIGFGHVMRSMALARAIVDAWRARVEFFLGESDGAAPLLEGAGLSVTRLDHGERWDPIALTRAGAERGDGPTWFVIDSYEATGEFCGRLRDGGGRVLVIDDLADRRLLADVVVNPNIHARALAYDVLPETRLLLGAQFALLGPEFRERRSRAAVSDCVKRIVVTLGGSDRSNLTRLVLDAISRLPRDLLVELDVHVLLGPGYRHRATLDAVLASADYTCAIHERVAGISTFMAEADLAITAGGGTLSETAHLGLPTVALVAAANQLPGATEFQRRGISVTLGGAGPVEPDAVAAALEAVITDRARRAEMSRRGRALVDGRGAERVARVMRDLAGSDGTAAVRSGGADEQR